jgi:hypothetical protein
MVAFAEGTAQDLIKAVPGVANAAVKATVGVAKLPGRVGRAVTQGPGAFFDDKTPAPPRDAAARYGADLATRSAGAAASAPEAPAAEQPPPPKQPAAGADKAKGGESIVEKAARENPQAPPADRGPGYRFDRNDPGAASRAGDTAPTKGALRVEVDQASLRPLKASWDEAAKDVKAADNSTLLGRLEETRVQIAQLQKQRRLGDLTAAQTVQLQGLQEGQKLIVQEAKARGWSSEVYTPKAQVAREAARRGQDR